MAIIAHIEDNKTDHELLKAVIRKSHKLIWFNNLTKFLNKKNQVDLIIADLGLPETYGIETLKTIRQTYPNKPLLALTGLAGEYMTGDMMLTLMQHASNVASKALITDPRIIEIIDELLSPQ